MPRPHKHVLVCVQRRAEGHPRGCCAQTGGDAVMNAFLDEFRQRALFEQFAVTNTGCLGPCGIGATVLVYPEGVLYGQVTPADVPAIIEEHLLGNVPVARLRAPAELWD